MFSSNTTIQAYTLAHLALQAGTQIEKLQRKGIADLSIVHRFADAISRFAGIDDSSEEATLDPNTTEILSMAASKTFQRPIQNSDLLIEEIRPLIKDFKAFQLDSHTDLELAKNFCFFIFDYISSRRSRRLSNEKELVDYEQSNIR